MVSAIKYLHSLEIAHRDLKCENVLISKHLNLKIADFGFARYTVGDNNEDIYSKTFCGSAAYASPEIIKGTPYLPTKADVWSMGIILSVMLFGTMPFDDSNLTRLREHQMSRKMNLDSSISAKLSKDCKDVMSECLTPNSEDRPSAENVYKMKWLDKRAMREILGRN